MRGEERRKMREKLLDSVFPTASPLLSKNSLYLPGLSIFVYLSDLLAGFHCEPYNNPADFFLDIINGDSSAVVLNREKTQMMKVNKSVENHRLFSN